MTKKTKHIQNKTAEKIFLRPSMRQQPKKYITHKTNQK